MRRRHWLPMPGQRGRLALTLPTLAMAGLGLAVLRAAPPTHVPAGLDTYLRTVPRLTAADTAALLAGRPVAKLLDADPSKEVAVFAAVWIAAPRSGYVARLQDIERFETGSAIRITRKISPTPALADFAALALPQEDFDDLRTCTVGHCDVKLSAEALQTLHATVDWNATTARRDADAAMRRLALDYVQAYRQGGNARLAVYRDGARPTFLSQEYDTMIRNLPSLTRSLPQVQRYLLGYPQVTLPNSTDFMYWQEVTFGLKPIIRINHLTIADEPGATTVASKQVYASHYFWTALELRVLLDDPARGDGFWFVTENRSRSDGLSGFLGSIVRRRVRTETLKGSLALMQATKRSLEARPH